MFVQIRFNTESLLSGSKALPWRIIIDGKEHLATHVEVTVPTYTTKDEVAPGIWKWHLSCQGLPEWDAEKNSCRILAVL